MRILISIMIGLGIGVAAMLAAPRLGIEIPGLPTSPVGAGSPDPGEPKILYWVAPMDPNYRRDGPGKSPMGMDLVPVYEGEQSDAPPEPGVRISPAVVNNIGVRTATVERADLQRRIETVGYVAYDENRVSHVHLRADGWIEDLRIKYVGQRVRAGDLLFRLYSRMVINAQSEYLLAVRGGREALIESAASNLRALGVSPGQIGRLGRRGRPFELIDILAQQDGVVAELNVAEGMFVDPASVVATIADLSTIWVLVDVFESQSQWVMEGDEAVMQLPYMPGERWEGRVDYIYPSIDPMTRTLRVRLRFDNPDERLKPNMYAEVTLHGQPRRDAVAIPRQAVIRTGGAQRVVLAHEEGRFEPVQVRAGMESGELVEILEGLEPGQRIVVSGQFLIDSESSLTAGMERMSATAPAERFPGTGVFHSTAGDSLNLSHEPIAELGWPAMTMDLGTTAPGMGDGLSAGDRVHFHLVRGDSGGYLIESIQRIEASGTGVIHSLDPAQGLLNMSHDPIAELGWPQMRMDFRVREPGLLGGFGSGDRVAFDLVREASGGYAIVSLQAVAPPAPAAAHDHHEMHGE